MMSRGQVAAPCLEPPPPPPPPLLASSPLSRYLSRRRHQAPTSTTVPIAHFALRSLVLGAETSTNDAVQFACSTSDPIQIEQQYSKFKIWISESPDSLKPELAQLLYPTFTHLYLELICSGQKQFAQKFHKRHQSTFLGNAEFATFIRQLAPVLSPDDIAGDETISAFHGSKYSVTLSNKTFHFLMRYLHGCSGHPVLLHVLRGKVDLKLADALGASSKSEALRRMEQDRVEDAKAAGCPSSEVDEQAESKAAATTRLLETIRAVREGPTSLPTSCLFRLDHPYSHFTSSAVTRDCKRLAAGAEDGSVHVWNLMPQQGQQLLHPRRRAPQSRIQLGCDVVASSASSSSCDRERDIFEAGDARKLLGHRGPVFDVAFVESAATGGHLLSVGEDTTMRIWNVAADTNVAVYRGHSYPVWSLDVDSLGISVATGSMDRTAKLWHLEYTHPIRIYAGHESDVDVVKFHPNCNYLATGSIDKSVRLWSHADAKMVRVYSGHRGSVTALSFSPDGKLLASAGEDRHVRVWDLAASAVLRELRGHSGTVQALAWSADSSLLASAGMDGCVRMWDVKGGEQESAAAAAAAFPTGCVVIGLEYSRHNTLLVTGNGEAANVAVNGGLEGTR